MNIKEIQKSIDVLIEEYKRIQKQIKTEFRNEEIHLIFPPEELIRDFIQDLKCLQNDILFEGTEYKGDKKWMILKV